MLEFLTTTLVKTSTSILLTDAPGGPGGPIQKKKNKTKAFICKDALLSSYILSCADVSTLYHAFILYIYIFLLFIQNGENPSYEIVH